jgi:two-component system chemotaxis response regulator CheB
VTAVAPAAARIRVLVVDDSRFMRGLIRGLLHSDPQIEVVGEVADGVAAIDAVAALAPDVVTMDVHMPRAGGLDAVARLMAERPTPIVMLSADTQHGSTAAVQALALGAVDVIPKPSGRVDPGLTALRETIVRKVKMAARIRPVRTVGGTGPRGATGLAGPGPLAGPPAAASACVVLAASTGGPAALMALVPALPRDLPAAVLVVQHLPARYTAQLARELAARAMLPVREAADGERLTPGVAYVAPGARDVVVSRGGILTLRPGPPGDGAAPSADVAMASVARHAGAAAIGVVLTGMGTDGALGAEAIARAGGRVIAQDEASSVVFGMARAAVKARCVNVVAPLREIAPAVVRCLMDPGAHRDRAGDAAPGAPRPDVGCTSGGAHGQGAAH